MPICYKSLCNDINQMPGLRRWRALLFFVVFCIKGVLCEAMLLCCRKGIIVNQQTITSTKESTQLCNQNVAPVALPSKEIRSELHIQLCIYISRSLSFSLSTYIYLHTACILHMYMYTQVGNSLFLCVFWIWTRAIFTILYDCFSVAIRQDRSYFYLSTASW